MNNWLGSALVALTMLSACEEDAALESGDAGSTSAAADGLSDAGVERSTEAGPTPAPSAFDGGPDGATDGGLASDSALGPPGQRDAGLFGPPLSDPNAAPVPTVSDVIETVGFDQSQGGFPVPVLLFQGGYASFNVEQIVKPIDIAYDVVEHPSEWPAWHRTAMGVELKYSAGWKPLMYKYECASLPKGTTLAGTFQRRTDTVVGSEIAVQTIARYRFAVDGTFETCKVTTTAIVSPGRVSTDRAALHGTYEIDGYKVRFAYSDGTSTTVPFFYDPMRPTRLWVDREPFPNPTVVETAICVDP